MRGKYVPSTPRGTLGGFGDITRAGVPRASPQQPHEYYLTPTSLYSSTFTSHGQSSPSSSISSAANSFAVYELEGSACLPELITYHTTTEDMDTSKMTVYETSMAAMNVPSPQKQKMNRMEVSKLQKQLQTSF